MCRWVLPLLVATALPAQQEAPRPTLRAGTLTGPVRLDGRLSEPAWATADSIAGLTQVIPTEGASPSTRTVIRVLAGERELVFGLMAYGAPGLSITSFSKARDADPDGEDYLALVLDTFQDGRTGYVFAVNPAGARVDGLVAEQGNEMDESWDGIWEAATAREGNSWSAEIRIPLRTLIFRPGLTSWGFNVERQLMANREQSRWTAASQDLQLTQTSRAGLLTGLPPFALGLGLAVRPAVTAGAGYPSPGAELDGDVKPSLDLTKRLGANQLASVTFNTDFAETDVDARRTNLTRFPLFFPEKRPFFLEGRDVFEFGSGLGEELLPFFSRRIGLLAGQAVPLRAGGKLDGRGGGSAVGALLTRTGSVAGLSEGRTLGAARVRRHILGESSVGVIGTLGDPQGRAGAWTGGADLLLSTSRFAGDRNLRIGLWGLLTRRDGLVGNRSAFGVSFAYPNDLWDLEASARQIGDGFDPSLGFVPRRGIRRYQVGADFQPRPGRWGIRQMFFEQSATIVTDLNDRWESYRFFLAPLNWELESGDRFEFNVVPEGERLTEPFEVSDDVILEPGAYRYTRYRLELETASQRELSGQATWWFGSFYTGHLHEVELEANWKPGASFGFEAELEHAAATLPEGSFTETVLGVRALVNFSPDLNLSSLVQYDTDSRNLGTNTRLRWTFHPAGELYVVYNHNLERLRRRFSLESNQLLIKVQHTLRY